MSQRKIAAGIGALRPALRRRWRPLAASASCIAASGLVLAADPLLLRLLIDDALPNRNLVQAVWVCGALCAVYAAYFSLYAAGRVWETAGAQRVADDLRLGLFKHAQRVSSAAYASLPVGDWCHRLHQDVDTITEILKQGLRYVVTFCSSSVVSLAVMWFLDWRLALCLAGAMPFAWLSQHILRPRLARASEDLVRREAAHSAFLHEHLGAVRQITLLTAERRQLRRYGEHLAVITRGRVRRTALEMATTVATGVVVQLATVIALAVGTVVTIRGEGTVGNLVAFYSCAIRIIVPIQLLAELWASLPRLRASLDRVQHMREMPVICWPSPRTDPGPVIATSGAMSSDAGLRVRDVVFGYGPDAPILRGLSLAVNDGEPLAVAGPSGCGKSTLVSLIVRLHDCDRGAITIDGVPITRMTVKALRSLVALVPQEPVLFDLTVRENLLLANPRATHAAMIDAIELARFDSVLSRLPLGLDQPLGPSASTLSGGERQRLALARAILRRPRILILDEATSALDPDTEHAVLSGLRIFARDRIVISIAHRRSVAHWAARIAVMQQGRVVACGPHAVLYRTCDLYRQLYDREWPTPSADRENEVLVTP
jgi:ABC-type multidrug transport system fused ATPase/permease subunit